MKYLAVKNYDRFQHYKDRSPPWIKLYNALLDDYAFLQLSEVDQIHLTLMWLVASRHDNRIPYDETYIRAAIRAKRKVDIPRLIASGFVIVVEQDASTQLAERQHDASNGASKPIAKRKQTASRALATRASARSRETETETETDTAFDQTWQLYPHRAGSNPRSDAEHAHRARIRDGEDVQVLRAGTVRYATYCVAMQLVGTPYVMQGKRFYGPAKPYCELYELPSDPAETAALAARAQQDVDEQWLEQRMRETNAIAT